MRKLVGFDYSIEYKLGMENVIISAFSRQHDDTLSYLAFTMTHLTFVDKLKQEYTELPGFIKLIFDHNAGLPLKRELKWFNGLLYKGHQIFLLPTSSLIPILLTKFHSILTVGHFRVTKT